MIIDTHCHYNCEPLLSQIKKHWQNALRHNVAGGICIGTDLKNNAIALDLAQKFPTMFVSIGIHPEELTEKIKTLWPGESYSNQAIENMINDDMRVFENLLKGALDQKNQKLIAIGEMGLDYYRLKTKGVKRENAELLQKKAFTKQLELAFEHDLVAILHVRDQADRTEANAYYDTYQIVTELIAKYEAKSKNIPTLILHCASGPKDYIQKFLDLGAYLGFAGHITYENATDLREIFKMTPKDRVLLETDAPFLAPGQKKGEVCEPFYITQTAKYLQDNFQLDLDIIKANTLKVFPEFLKLVQ